MAAVESHSLVLDPRGRVELTGMVMPDRRHVVMLLANPCSPDPRVVREAQALVAAGLRVTIIALDRMERFPRQESVGDVDIVRVDGRSHAPFGPLRDVMTILRFWREARRLVQAMRPDAVHCHDLPTLPAGVWATRRRHVPLVYDAHEAYGLYLKSKGHQFVGLLAGLVERLCYKRVTAIITVSDLVVPYVAHARDDVVIVGNWYDPVTPDTAGSQALRDKLHLPGDAFTIVYVGSFGPERMIRPLLEYARSEPGVTVAIAGSPKDDSDLATAARELANVHVLGWQSDPGPVYTLGDAVYYGLDPSNIYSALSSPNTVFVAIARTIPIITTGVGMAGKLVRDHHIGTLMPTPDARGLRAAVMELRRDDKRQTVRRNLLELQHDYSWVKASASLAGVYARMGLA